MGALVSEYRGLEFRGGPVVQPADRISEAEQDGFGETDGEAISGLFAIMSNRGTGRQDRDPWGTTLVAVAEGRGGILRRSGDGGRRGVGVGGKLDGGSDDHSRGQLSAKQHPAPRHSCLDGSDRHGPRAHHHLS